MKSARLVSGILRRTERFAFQLKRKGFGRSAIGRGLVDTILWPSDWFKVRQTYRDRFGRPPRLLRPVTFNEKIQRRKLFERKPQFAMFADKLAVRAFVEHRIGREHLTEVYWSGTDVREAAKLRLPDRFVAKANHGSGTNLIVRDARAFDWDAAHLKTQAWLQHDLSAWRGERHYRWIEPRLFLEEFLVGADGDVPSDYKFFCFNGRVELVMVDFGRFTEHTRRLFDRDFNELPVRLSFARYQGRHERPPGYEKLVELAETLSAGEPFLRVDLYWTDRPVFGEITVTPGAGLTRFTPAHWDEWVGTLWKKPGRRPRAQPNAWGPALAPANAQHP